MDDQTLAGAYDTAIHGVMRAGYSQDAGLAAALAAHARQDPSRQDNYAALLAYSAELFTSRTQFKLHKRVVPRGGKMPFRSRKRFDEAITGTSWYLPYPIQGDCLGTWWSLIATNIVKEN